MLPSASIGINSKGQKKAMYEPVHGSAPDISGQGVSNPLAMILSVGMMFEYSLDKKIIAEKINDAVRSVLEKDFEQKIFTVIIRFFYQLTKWEIKSWRK